MPDPAPRRGSLFCTFPSQMRGDTGPVFGQAPRMILCAEYGLHFAKDGDRWRCVEYPGC